jgi:hypothetical protein
VVDTVSNFAGGAVKGVTDVANNIVDGVSNFANNTKEKVDGIFGKVGGWFSDTFNLKKTSNTSNQTSNKSTTNNAITINTSSSTFDIDSINRALGGKFI